MTDTGGPLTLARGSTSWPTSNGPMAGTLAGRVKVVFAGSLADGCFVLARKCHGRHSDSVDTGRDYHDVHPGQRRRLRRGVGRRDVRSTCDGRALGSPVVFTSTFNVSVAPPASVPTLQVALFAPEEVQAGPRVGHPSQVIGEGSPTALDRYRSAQTGHVHSRGVGDLDRPAGVQRE